MKNNTFATRFKQLRLDHGWTQDYIADHLGITRAAVSNWEQGLREPDHETTGQIADLFNCDLGFLLGKTSPDLTLDERYVIEVMRSKDERYKRLLSYAKFLLQEDDL